MIARRSAALVPLVVGLLACEGVPVEPLDEEIAANRSAAQCTNVALEVEAQLGLWMLDGQLVGGGTPAPVSLGGIDGWLASALVPDATVTHGRSETVHWTLVHVFATGEPGLADSGLGFPVASIELAAQESWFATEDRAVCAAAGGGGASCRVNDQLDIVAGAGLFEGARGFLHNHGTIAFTNPATGEGTGEFRIRGRVCGAGLGS